MADLDLMGYKRVIFKSALLPSVTLSRMVGTARLCLKHLARARARATEKSNVLLNLCTDLRGPSKTSWSNNLESRWSLEVRCWLVWSSIAPIFSFSSTIRLNPRGNVGRCGVSDRDVHVHAHTALLPPLLPPQDLTSPNCAPHTHVTTCAVCRTKTFGVTCWQRDIQTTCCTKFTTDFLDT